MFNSREVNNDPKPHYVPSEDVRVSTPFVISDDELTEYRPRPEYDNNPNQILMILRDNIRFDTRITPELHFKRMLLWVEMAQDMSESGIFSRAEEEHARRVLEKLVNVYG